MRACLLDTNTIGPVLRGDRAVRRKARQHVGLHFTLYISIISYYEVWRGLHDLALSRVRHVRRNARRRQHEFEEFCWRNQIVDLDKQSCQTAAQIYADLKNSGRAYELGVDLLIAAIAMTNHFTLVTANEKHFRDIQELHGLQIDNWLVNTS